MRPCFVFTNLAAADAAPATLSIYDEIGFWGVQAADFRASLASVTAKVINVEINSPGGDVFTGLAIYNMLRASGKEIVVKVMGVAASAASLIAMAGDKIIMPKNTFLMVHNPMAEYGHANAADLRDTAAMLEKIGASLLATYVAKTGMDEAEMTALLATNTWLTADEALSMGFATEVTEDIKATAAFDMTRADLPVNVVAAMRLSATPDGAAADALLAEQAEAERVAAEAAAAAAAEQVNTALAQQIHDATVAAGFTAYAPTFVVACATLDEARVRISTAREITALCVLTKLPDEADQLIRQNKTCDEARSVVAAALATRDENTHVDTTSKIENQQQTRSNAKPKVSTASLWASHNAQRAKK